MSPANPEGARQAEPLAHRLSDAADVVQIADAIIGTWQAAHAALMPIIGQGGVHALFQRSAHLSKQAHPWLASVQDGDPGVMDLGTLKALLLGQTAVQAHAGGKAMLQSFHGLLGSLLGVPLTNQLLGSDWHQRAGLAPTQDTSP